MSWHLNTAGTKDEVKAAINQCAASPSGMPAPVAAYLKDAVDACSDAPDKLVQVISSGHRPNLGGTEECTVRSLQRGPWPKS